MINREKEFSGIMPVRESAQFDPRPLQDYMAQHVEGFAGTLQVRQFKGGQSNPTYLLQAGKQQYVMRRKPPGKLLKSAHAVDREYRALVALADTPVPVPKVYCLCDDESVVGTWFYIMEYVPGRIFWDMELSAQSSAARWAIYDSMNEIIAHLHQVNYQAVGLADYGKSGNYVSRQISRWSQQYQLSQTEDIPAMDQLIEWLPQNLPDRDETTIVHGDYRMDNMVYHGTENRVVAVLDWELCTLGDPVADFSYHTMQWRLPPHLFNGIAGLDCKKLGIPTEEEYVAAYCQRTGRDSIENWDYYMIYNIFRIAAILQGIMGRARDGTASSPQAEAMGTMARPLAEKAWEEVQKL